ncbi:hypothetical protein DOTSEDRAFT_72613 [Dothistroma septosporum NZE10]|uniref:Uncharacterized protein n=1 Tax=Dothistroma septosporum (strain NZE10 / CBS 128990) TaxID=675120 RepID=M2Y4Q1_DOTSN|nr:hypothetical protein DOTSEDRAFT_72613 [Dothistroma septosporum NZE10]
MTWEQKQRSRQPITTASPSLERRRHPQEQVFMDCQDDCLAVPALRCQHYDGGDCSLPTQRTARIVSTLSRDKRCSIHRTSRNRALEYCMTADVF